VVTTQRWRAPVDRSSTSDDGGFILVALLIGVAISAIWMSAALPSWRQQALREREAELIFRGEQYARAIFLYRQKMNGALPANLDDLVSQHVLRRKWKDPITGDEFLPKVACAAAAGPGNPQAPLQGPRQGAPQPPARGRSGLLLADPDSIAANAFPRPDVVLTSLQVGGRGQGPPPPGQPAGPPSGRGGGRGREGAPGQPPGVPPGQGRGSGFPGRGGNGQFGGFGGAQVPQGGICGVQSKSTATSIRIYNGQQEYDLWQFDINTASILYTRNVAKLAGATTGTPGGGFAPSAGPTGVQGLPGGAPPQPGGGIQPPIQPGGRSGREE
jgi:type II secretory pathway pseudopilin PulG